MNFGICYFSYQQQTLQETRKMPGCKSQRCLPALSLNALVQSHTYGYLIGFDLGRHQTVQHVKRPRPTNLKIVWQEAMSIYKSPNTAPAPVFGPGLGMNIAPPSIISCIHGCRECLGGSLHRQTLHLAPDISCQHEIPKLSAHHESSSTPTEHTPSPTHEMPAKMQQLVRNCRFLLPRNCVDGGEETEFSNHWHHAVKNLNGLQECCERMSSYCSLQTCSAFMSMFAYAVPTSAHWVAAAQLFSTPFCCRVIHEPPACTYKLCI